MPSPHNFTSRRRAFIPLHAPPVVHARPLLSAGVAVRTSRGSCSLACTHQREGRKAPSAGWDRACIFERTSHRRSGLPRPWHALVSHPLERPARQLRLVFSSRLRRAVGGGGFSGFPATRLAGLKGTCRCALWSGACTHPPAPFPPAPADSRPLALKACGLSTTTATETTVRTALHGG